MKKFIVILLAALFAGQLRAAEVRLSQLDLSLIKQGWGKAQAGKSVTEKPLKIGDREFTDGVGTHATSVWHIQLDGKAEKFESFTGIDAAAGDARASIEFLVIGDGRELWRSGVCKLGDAAKQCE